MSIQYIELKKRRDEIVYLRQEIQDKITALKLPKNITANVVLDMGNELNERNRLLKLLRPIEDDLRDMNAKIKSLGGIEGSYEDYAIQVFKEVTGNELSVRVFSEARKRFNGCNPTKVGIKSDNSIAELNLLKGKINRLESKLHRIRNTMNSHMDKMERKMDRMEFANYIKTMSDLNKEIPSVTDIKKV